jgi:hypothetical protein
MSAIGGEFNESTQKQTFCSAVKAEARLACAFSIVEGED